MLLFVLIIALAELIVCDGFRITSGSRLYQLIRQKGSVEDHTFEIEFLDPGVRAFGFTFG